MVSDAAAAGQGVYPVGGRTTLDVGLPPTKPGVAVDTTALNQVVDYPARDMTITVGAGITVARLQEILAEEGQWLPVDIPDAERATLGGAVALNKSGPRRLGYGTLRDYVIGIRFVTDEGAEVGAGGRVVKNVAGYDLMKLQTGAVGTLGVITQLTLKVRPKPEASALVAFGCEPADLLAALDGLHASKSRPVAVELLNRPAADAAGLGGPAPWVIVAGFEEKAVTVSWQVNALLGEVGPAMSRYPATVHQPDAGPIWRALTELQRRAESRSVWKVSVRPSRVAELVAAGGFGAAHGSALSGVLFVHDPEDPADLERRIAAAGGNVSVARCPTADKARLPVWGRPGGDRGLMRHVKRTLDPADVFNPGRLFGGV